MAQHFPTLVTSLIDQLKQINAGATILPTRLDPRLVMVQLNNRRKYNLSVLYQKAFEGLYVNYFSSGMTCDQSQAAYFLIDLDKSTL